MCLSVLRMVDDRWSYVVFVSCQNGVWPILCLSVVRMMCDTWRYVVFVSCQSGGWHKTLCCVYQLSEWWKNVTYLDYRIPLVVNFNPAVVFPQQSYRGKDEQLRSQSSLCSCPACPCHSFPDTFLTCTRISWFYVMRTICLSGSFGKVLIRSLLLLLIWVNDCLSVVQFWQNFSQEFVIVMNVSQLTACLFCVAYFCLHLSVFTFSFVQFFCHLPNTVDSSFLCMTVKMCWVLAVRKKEKEADGTETVI